MRVCNICSKGSMNGNKISHSHRLTKRKWKPNLQKLSVSLDGTTVALRVCSKCMKKISKTSLVG